MSDPSILASPVIAPSPVARRNGATAAFGVSVAACYGDVDAGRPALATTDA